MKRAFLAFNPASGRFPPRSHVERTAKILRMQGWQLRVEQTQSGEHITQLARQAAQEGMEAFFIAGGDGSINKAVAGLLGSKTALGVLPAGTSNVWAKELGLVGLSLTRWQAIEESARRLAEADVHLVDVGLCNGIPFLLWAGVGLDAFVVHHIEPRERWEKHFAVVQYLTTTVWSASFWPGINIRVSIDGQQVSGHYLLAVISNIHLYAGGIANLSPDARLDDGMMDLWLFKGETLGDTVQRMWDLYSGRHHQSDQIIHYPFRSLSLEADSTIYIQMDGDPAPAQNPLLIEVYSKALPVLIPQNTPHQLFEHTSTIPMDKT